MMQRNPFLWQSETLETSFEEDAIENLIDLLLKDQDTLDTTSSTRYLIFTSSQI